WKALPYHRRRWPLRWRTPSRTSRKTRSRAYWCCATSRGRRSGDGRDRSWRSSAPLRSGPGSPRSQYSPRSGDGVSGDGMYHWIPFWPDTAAVNGVVVNNLYIAELAVSGVIMLTVVAMMLTFCVRYRSGGAASRSSLIRATWYLEIAWTVATLGVFLILFVWCAQIYVWLFQSPPADEEVYVVGKQWMWKVEHPGGQREIDALHVPIDKTIRVVMASEDVIHSFFVPAFRIKRDVVPGTLQTIWFKADKT